MKYLILFICSISLAGFRQSPKREQFSLGLIKKPVVHGVIQPPPDKAFLQMETKLPGKFHLRDKYKLSKVLNQMQCGSCVTFSVIRNLQDSYLIHGVDLPLLSKQFVMDCGKQGSCNGSWFEVTAEALLKLKGDATEAQYPYKARNQSCQGAPSELVGQIKSYRLIDNSPKSIMTAIYSGYPVSVTVGAGGSFMNYDEGIFDDCQNIGTNHETLLEGFNCESSVDSEGNCKFDENGKLPSGVGHWNMVNSWGTGFASGESTPGEMRIKITSNSGRRCNNIADEAGILDLGFPIPTPTPSPSPIPPAPVPWNIPSWVKWVAGVLAAIAAFLSGHFLWKNKQ